MFKLYANKVRLQRIDEETITSGSVNAYDVYFQFDSNWTGLSRTAIFLAGDIKKSVLLDETGYCTIPWEVMQEDGRMLYAGVYGTRTDEDGTETVVLPTMWVELGLIEVGATLGDSAQPPTPDIYNQILSAAQEAIDVAQSVRDDADDGKFNGEPGQPGEPGAQGEPGEPGTTFTPRVDSEGNLSWTNDGDLPNPEVVNIRGPQGLDGEPGDTGPKGDKGDKGDPGTGLSIKGQYKSLESLQLAVPSPAIGDNYYVGVSAPYDVYTWAEVDGTPQWIDGGALQGAPGEKGDKGAPGEDGGYYSPSVDDEGNLTWTASDPNMLSVAGANIKGPKGDKGDKGDTGDTGPQGEPGMQGEQGIQGPPGEKGDTGNTGPAGADGAPGQDGADGLPALTYGKVRNTTVVPTIGGITNFLENGDNPPSYFNRTPVVGDVFVLLQPRTTTGQSFITEVKITHITPNIVGENVAVIETTGEQGEPGTAGETGQQGPPGIDGQDGAPGEDGGYYTPTVDGEGNLTWAGSKGDMPPVEGTNIRGPAGADGQGIPEITPEDNGKVLGALDGVTVWVNSGGVPVGELTSDDITMAENITLAGNYTQVGNWTKAQNGTAVKEVEGMTLTEVFRNIFTATLQPTITAQPSIGGFNLTSAGAVEAGTSVAIASYTAATLNPGSYTYGPETGVTAESWMLERVTNVGSTQIGTFVEASLPAGTDNNGDAGFVIGDVGGENVVSSLRYRATVQHTAGVTAHDNLGGDSSPVVAIAAGSKNKQTNAYTPYRNYFYGATTDKPTLDSTYIRGLTKSNRAYTAGTITLNVPAGANRVCIACIGTATGVTQVINETALNADVTATFTQTTVAVEGANGYTAQDYKVWTFEPAVPYENAAVLKVTLG